MMRLSQLNGWSSWGQRPHLNNKGCIDILHHLMNLSVNVLWSHVDTFEITRSRHFKEEKLKPPVILICVSLPSGAHVPKNEKLCYLLTGWNVSQTQKFFSRSGHTNEKSTTNTEDYVFLGCILRASPILFPAKKKETVSRHHSVLRALHFVRKSMKPPNLTV